MVWSLWTCATITISELLKRRDRFAVEGSMNTKDKPK